MTEADVTMAAKRHGMAGFTLIEVMVAASLLLIVLTPLPRMLVSAVQASMTSETQNTAALLAQEQIEELRGLAYSALVLNSALVHGDSGIQGNPTLTTLTNPTLTYAYGTGMPPSGTPWNVVADPDGTVVPVSEDVVRRKVSFTIMRYVLWADAQQTFKKLIVKVSWVKPRPAELVLETDAENIAGADKRPPVVIGTFPYKGDAFHTWTEIQFQGASAVARDDDGSVTGVTFQYKKNLEANFTAIGGTLTGTPIGDKYYRYSVAWNTSLGPEDQQYNLRVIATDNNALSSVETHSFFIDKDPPPPPASIQLTNPEDGTAPSLRLTNPDGTPIDPVPTVPSCTWPPRLSWPAVEDYIPGNTSFNMTIGYLVDRQEKLKDSVDPVGDNGVILVGSLYGPDTSEFLDAADLDPTKEYRYRIKSLGRAAYWRSGGGLASLTPTAWTTWVTVDEPATPGDFPVFKDYEEPPYPSGYPAGTKVVAEPTGWDAIILHWKAQQDVHGHIADLYLVYRRPDGTDSWTLVNSVRVADATAGGVVSYSDNNLTRDASFQYRIVPVYTPEYLPANPNGLSTGVSAITRTNIY